MHITLHKDFPLPDCDLGTIPAVCLDPKIRQFLQDHKIYDYNLVIDSNIYNLFIYVNGDRICVNYN